MPRTRLALVLLTLSLAAVPASALASASGVVVSEFRFRGAAGASDEFVELANAAAAPVDVSGWRVQACSATTGAAVTRATIPAGTTLAPGQRLLVAHATGYTGPVAADLTYGTGIADGGGARVVGEDGALVDGVASTAAATSECREGAGLSLPTTDSDTSFERHGGFHDTDDNAADFGSAESDPQNLASLPPVLSVDDIAVAEGAPAMFTLSLSAPAKRPVTVDVATADGTATAPADYAAGAATVTIPAGSLSATFAVVTVADGLDEPDETFSLVLAAPTRATLADASASAAILDGDAEPSLSVTGASVLEGGNATFAVALSAPSAFPVSVAYATVDGTATAPDDYAATTGTLVLEPGETSATVSIATVDDVLDELDETFSLVLRDPVHAVLADDRAEATIEDDDEATPDEPGTITAGTVVAAGRLAGQGTLVALVRAGIRDAAPRGHVRYVAPGVRLTSTRIASLTIAGGEAVVTGTARVGRVDQSFRLVLGRGAATLAWSHGSVSGPLRGVLIVWPG